MSEDTVVCFQKPESPRDALTELLRQGAQQLLKQAVESELAGHPRTARSHTDRPDCNARMLGQSVARVGDVWRRRRKGIECKLCRTRCSPLPLLDNGRRNTRVPRRQAATEIANARSSKPASAAPRFRAAVGYNRRRILRAREHGVAPARSAVFRQLHARHRHPHGRRRGFVLPRQCDL